VTTQKPKIIGVSGGSGSGKTTLVNRLRAACGDADLLVIQMDHYYLDLSHLPQAERDRRNFDHPEAFDMALLQAQLCQLLAGRPVDRPTYDFASHTRTGVTLTLPPKRVIVLDGILALHDSAIRKLYDLSIFVDVSDDVRFIRRLSRDIDERGRTMDGVIGQYLGSVREMHNLHVSPQKLVADIIVSWQEYNDRAVEMLSGMLRSWLADA
jgi:uridine kinase